MVEGEFSKTHFLRRFEVLIFRFWTKGSKYQYNEPFLFIVLTMKSYELFRKRQVKFVLVRNKAEGIANEIIIKYI